MSNEVILVDESNNALGKMDKLLAHQRGVLHRAYSVIIYNKKNEMLIQQRAWNKYHSGGLWSNACCSHPTEEHNMEAGIKQRITDELGIYINDIIPMYHFIYEAPLGNGLIEHELDFVYKAYYDDDIVGNPEEIADWKYVSIDTLLHDIKNNPESFTPWFKMIINSVHNNNLHS